MKENLSQGAGARTGLYPPIEPFRQQILEVPGGHRIYVEQCGRPDGEPVVVLHGGPGGGCNAKMRRFHDPAKYRIVLFDQRGSGRSTTMVSNVVMNPPILLSGHVVISALDRQGPSSVKWTGRRLTAAYLTQPIC